MLLFFLGGGWQNIHYQCQGAVQKDLKKHYIYLQCGFNSILIFNIHTAHSNPGNFKS